MLTIQYVPFAKIIALESRERIETLLSMLKSGKIIIIDGRLSSADEAFLIRRTMECIDETFNGVEIGVMHDNERKGFFSRLKSRLAGILVGTRSGITFIGPAKVISEMRSNPENVELHFQNDFLLKHASKKADHKRNSHERSSQENARGPAKIGNRSRQRRSVVTKYDPLDRTAAPMKEKTMTRNEDKTGNEDNVS